MATNRRASTRRDAVLGSLVFLVVAPGTVAVLVPWVISRWRMPAYPGDAFLRPLGIVAIALAATVLVEAFARFIVQGSGTPAPAYPTDRLIVGGTYRHVRNPIYMAVVTIILGQAALFGAPELTIYAAIMAIGFHLFVILVEEPTLKRRFPQDYRRYRENVRRWLPRLRPWKAGP